MIGDRKFDIQGGKMFNLDTIGVLYGYGSEKEITENQPTHIVKNVEELTELLLNYV